MLSSGCQEAEAVNSAVGVCCCEFGSRATAEWTGIVQGGTGFVGVDCDTDTGAAGIGAKKEEQSSWSSEGNVPGLVVRCSGIVMFWSGTLNDAGTLSWYRLRRS